MRPCAILFIVLTSQPAMSQEHWMTVYAFQSARRPQPASSHTFATFTRSSPAGVASVTISWYPTSGLVRLAAARPEPGRNLSLEETLALAAALRAEVSFRGPYPVAPELFERAMRQAGRLDSGAVAYKAVDRGYRPRASNCIHAVADLDADPPAGVLRTGLASGRSASARVVRHLQRWILPGAPGGQP